MSSSRRSWLRRFECAVVAAALVALAGCPASPPPTHPLRWARAWINALNSRQLGHFDALLGTPGSYEDAALDGARSGEALAYVLVWRWNHLPAMHYELERATGTGNMIAVEFTATASASPAVPPQHGIFIIELQDNLIARVRAY